MSIEVRDVTKWFGKFCALHEVSLTIGSGELVALLGPSGSGKTTLLRIISGLEQPNTGGVLFDGRDVTGVHVRERGVGFVFQHYALFRHMSVFENVAFGLRVLPRSVRPSKRQIRNRVEELLNLVHLHGLASRYPQQLSGGQRQRVALARALAVQPKVLLLDEPFGALDAKVRLELRRWLRRLHAELHVTSVFVTHDQDEALEVADRVAVLDRGRIHQVGTPRELYDSPKTSFVAEFLGEVNLFEGRVQQGAMTIGALRLPVEHFVEGTPLRVAIRTSDITLEPDEYGPATITRVANLGDRLKIMAEIEGAGVLVAQVPRDDQAHELLTPGSRVRVGAGRIRAYPNGQTGSYLN